MKPAVPSAVPYLDMRLWQHDGMKLQGQCTHGNRRGSREGESKLLAQSGEGLGMNGKVNNVNSR